MYTRDVGTCLNCLLQTRRVDGRPVAVGPTHSVAGDVYSQPQAPPRAIAQPPTNPTVNRTLQNGNPKITLPRRCVVYSLLLRHNATRHDTTRRHARVSTSQRQPLLATTSWSWSQSFTAHRAAASVPEQRLNPTRLTHTHTHTHTN